MTELSTKILKEIRDEIRGLGDRLDRVDSRLETMNARIDTTNERLDTSIDRLDRLERRQVEMEVRLATELVAVVGAVREVRDAILEDRTLRSTVRDHEQRIIALEQAKNA